MRTLRRDDVPTLRREGNSGVLNPHSVATLRRDDVRDCWCLVHFVSYMVLHKSRTHYSYVFEIEMCGLKLNRSALKFLESWISKNHVEIIGEINRVYDSRS